MLLKDIVGKTKLTADPPPIHPKELLVEFEIDNKHDSLDFITGSGTIITDDGLVLTARHVLDVNSSSFKGINYRVKSLDGIDYFFSDPIYHDYLDLAAVKLFNYSRDNFQLTFSNADTNQLAEIYSYVQGSVLKKKGKVFAPNILYQNKYSSNPVSGILVNSHLSETQSGSLILGSSGEIFGLASEGEMCDKPNSNNSHFLRGPKSADIIKFLRKVYRQIG